MHRLDEIPTSVVARLRAVGRPVVRGVCGREVSVARLQQLGVAGMCGGGCEEREQEQDAESPHAYVVARRVRHTRPVEGIAHGPDGGEQVVRAARHHRILAELPELEVIELRFGPDFEGVDLHAHADHVDSFYVLEGEAEFTFAGDVFCAGPGSYVAAPVGVEHGFRNAGAGELRLLNVHAPNVGFAQRLRRA